MDQQNENQNGNQIQGTPNYMVLGMMMGAAIGAAIGMATENLTMWLPIGVAMGVALGAGMNTQFGALRDAQEENRLAEEPEDAAGEDDAAG